MKAWSQCFAHEVKAASITLGYDRRTGATAIHKAGCGHEAKLDNVHPFDTSEHMAGVHPDDWFEVAPCARKAGA